MDHAPQNDQRPHSVPTKNQIAAKVKIGNAEVILYNRMDKYILYSILKELNSDD
jgi:hypothetical protein